MNKRYAYALGIAAILLVMGCGIRTADVPRGEFESASQDASASHRIKTTRGDEYIVQAFSVTDSTVVISRLASSEHEYRGRYLPITLPLRDVASIGRVNSNQKLPLIVFGSTLLVIFLLHRAFGGDYPST